MGSFKSSNFIRDGVVPSPRGDTEPGRPLRLFKEAPTPSFAPALTELAKGMFGENDAPIYTSLRESDVKLGPGSSPNLGPKFLVPIVHVYSCYMGVTFQGGVLPAIL